jgi:hypothetical protein
LLTQEETGRARRGGVHQRQAAAAALLEVGDDPSWAGRAAQEQMGRMARWAEQ